MKRHELTKEQWEHIKELLPPERAGKRERPRKDNRRMLKGCSGSPAAERNGGKCRRRIRVCPICQMAGRWHIGSHIPRIVRRCGYGKPEPGLCLHQGSRKCQRRGKTTDKAQVGEPEAGWTQSCTLSWMDRETPLHSRCLRETARIQSTLLNC